MFSEDVPPTAEEEPLSAVVTDDDTDGLDDDIVEDDGCDDKEPSSFSSSKTGVSITSSLVGSIVFKKVESFSRMLFVRQTRDDCCHPRCFVAIPRCKFPQHYRPWHLRQLIYRKMCRCASYRRPTLSEHRDFLSERYSLNSHSLSGVPCRLLPTPYHWFQDRLPQHRLFG